MSESQSFISVLQYSLITTHANDASTAILLYDYLLTFPREVSLVWAAPWTVMKVLFLLTRYLPFVDVAFRFLVRARIDPPVSMCHVSFAASAWLFYFGTALPEIILTVRTWAVWDRDRRLAIALLIFFAICWVSVIPVIIDFVRSLEFMVYTTPSRGFSTCFVTKGSHNVFWLWCMLLIYEAVMFMMMLIKGIRCYRCSGSSQTFKVVFRDGLLYYLYLFAFSLANVVVVSTVPPELEVVLIVGERFIHPILACRAVLDIRGQVTNRSHAAMIISAPAVPHLTPRTAGDMSLSRATSRTSDGAVDLDGQTDAEEL